MSKNSIRTTDSTDRIVALSATGSANPNAMPKTAVVRFSVTTRRILNALMQSLATPHI